MRARGSSTLVAPRLPRRDGVLVRSLRDLRDDFAELAGLARGTCGRLAAVDREVRAAREHFRPRTLDAAIGELEWARQEHEQILGELRTLERAAADALPLESAVDDLAERKRDYAEAVRTLTSFAAAAMTSTDWQSPSFAASGPGQAGRFTGMVSEHVDDYRRDRHHDAARFEEAYLREYVDRLPRMELHALMTNCGMSAFTTVLQYLAVEGSLDGPVVAGRSTYHECLRLLRQSEAADRLVEVDESDTGALLETLDRVHPSALFMDSLCNSKGIAVPDLAALLERLARSLSRRTYVVVDNTGLSCFLQPFSLLPADVGDLRVLVVESLTKYPQFGLDRTTAGMIVAAVEDAIPLSAYREHLGTNVGDTSAFLVPRPDRSALERRLARIGRNALTLAEHVDLCAAARPGGPVRGAVHPGLPGHPSFPAAGRLQFQGGFFEIELRPDRDAPRFQRRFVGVALEEARTRGVPLVAGASFGFDVTRIYATSEVPVDRPFLRVAAGTEHALGLERLKDALGGAVARVGAEA